MLPTSVNRMIDLPIRQAERRRTDVLCTIISSLFVIFMFIMAMSRLNTHNLRRMTYPTDTEGMTCGLDNQNHPYAYFTSIEDPTKRLCVNKCPAATDEYLSCKATRSLSCKRNSNPQFLVQIYDSKLEDSRLGLFCFPADPIIKKKLLQNSDLYYKYHFLVAYDGIRVGLLAAFVFGLLYLAAVQFLNASLPRFVIGAGGLMFIVLAIMLFSINSHSFSHALQFKIIVGILLLIFGISLFILLFYFNQDLRVCGIFLKHACYVVKSKLVLFTAIPVFIVLMTILLSLFLVQLLAIWSSANMVFEPRDIYIDPQGNHSVLWTVFNFIMLLWGLEFLKHAFAFIISGYTINYYYNSYHINPVKVLVLYHWGSVAAGAFLLHLLVYPDLIFDAFMPADEVIVNKPVGCCGSFCQRTFGWLKHLFELARSESMAYINLTGLPYLNSSRYCQYINRFTNLYNGNQSVNRLYRVGAHGLLVGLTVITTLIYMLVKSGDPSLWALLFVAGSSFFVVTFFVSLHADASEALLITFLTQLLLCHNDLNAMTVCPGNLREDIRVDRAKSSYQAFQPMSPVVQAYGNPGVQPPSQPVVNQMAPQFNQPNQVQPISQPNYPLNPPR